MKRTVEEILIDNQVAAKQRERDRAVIKAERAKKAEAEQARVAQIRADREVAMKTQLRSRYFNFNDQQYDEQWPQIYAKIVGDQVKTEVEGIKLASKVF